MPFMPGSEHHNYKHGHCIGGNPSGTHKSWVSMKARCDDAGSDNYHLYGGRGIRYCEEWSDFSVFLNDMGERPVGFTLDRLDPNGNYEPGNCRWASPKQQALNKRESIYIDFNGFNVPIRELGLAYGVPTTTIYRRYKQGYKGVDLVTKKNMNERRVGSRCPSSKLSEHDVMCIKRMISDGARLRVIAERYGVSQPTISEIKAGKTWAHVLLSDDGCTAEHCACVAR